MGVRVRISVVISTLGKSPILDLALESISKQRHPAEQVVVVDQSQEGQVHQLAENWNATYLTSERGAAHGRNVGLAALRDCDAVAFLDDDCTYAPDAFETLTTLFEESGADVISGPVRSDGATRVAFDGERRLLGRRSVWTHSIEASTVYRKSMLDVVGGFDETLGVGCPTRWQSGEGTDLLLRVMQAGGRVVYDPSFTVTEFQRPTSPDDYLRKVRNYARGTGRVYQSWYSPWECAALVLKPGVAALTELARGRRYEASKKWQSAIGRAEGVLGS